MDVFIEKCRRVAFPAAAFLTAALVLIETIVFVLWREMWVDELFPLFKSYLIFTGEFIPFREGIFPYAPLVIPLHGAVQYLLGPSLYAGRIVSAFFFVSALAVMAVVARRLGGRAAAVVALLLVLSNFLLVSVYLSATMYSAAAFLLLTLVLVETSSLSERKKTVLGGILVGLMVLARINLVAAVLIYLAYLLFLRTSWRGVALFAGVFFAVVVLGYIPLMAANPSLAASNFLHVFVGFGPFAGLTPLTDPSILRFLAELTGFFKEYYGYLLLFFSFTILIFMRERRRLVPFLRQERVYALLLMLSLGLLAAHYFYPKFVGKLFYANYFMPVLILAVAAGFGRWMRREAWAPVLIAGVIALNFATNLYRTDVVSHPGEESDLARLGRGADLLRGHTRPGDKILTFDNSLAHLYLADRRTYAPLLQRDFLYLGDTDIERVRRAGFYNLAMIKEWLGHDADYFLMHKETSFEQFRRQPYWGERSEDTAAKVGEIRAILESDYELAATASNVYPRKYTEGNDGGTLELYRRKKQP